MTRRATTVATPAASAASSTAMSATSSTASSTAAPAAALTASPTASPGAAPPAVPAASPPAAATSSTAVWAASCLAALAVLCLTAAPSHACKKRHQTPFELFDVAATVAHVRVRSTPPPAHLKNAPGPGDVKLEVLQLVKPARAPSASAPAALAELTSHLDGSSCDVPFRDGETALIFLDDRGWTAGAHEGYLRAAAPWQPVMTAWAAAADATARAAVLVDAATAADAAVRSEAAHFLVDEPALLAALDQAQRARLVAQLSATDDKSAAPDLALVLVRLRERAAIAKLPKWMKLARAIAAVTRFERERDPEVLAAAIAAAKKPAERWAAFERCERVRATRLASFRRTADDLDKVTPAALAASCREGTALAR